FRQVAVRISTQKEEHPAHAHQVSIAVQIASQELLHRCRDAGEAREEDIHNRDLSRGSVNWRRTTTVKCVHSGVFGGFLKRWYYARYVWSDIYTQYKLTRQTKYAVPYAAFSTRVPNKRTQANRPIPRLIASLAGIQWW
ncbi:hypothetical protein ACJ73_08659, partial [Blastomyces percursus]